MRTGQELLADVRSAQEELGAGDPGDALAQVEPILEETAEAVRSIEFVTRPGADRSAILEAFCYARVTAVLALESQGAATAQPRIRAIVGEVLDVAAHHDSAWKVCCAAAEMLARSGDSDGAVWAVQAAERLAPEDEDYVTKLRGSLQSMFPTAFSSNE